MKTNLLNFEEKVSKGARAAGRSVAVYLMVGFMALSQFACNRDDGDGDTNTLEVFSQSDQTFATRAGNLNVSEIEFAKVAIERAQDPGVRALAQKIHDDHTAAQNELIEIGARKNLEIPRALTNRDQDRLQELRDEDADAFDEEFTEDQARILNLYERYFEDQIEDGDDQDLKNYANKYLPAISSNQDAADGLEDAVD